MKKFSIEFKWAAIATLAALIWMFFIKSMGYHQVEKIRYVVGFDILFNIVLILLYYLAIRQKKKEYYNGTITWQKAFLSGLAMCIMVTFFYPLIQYITFKQVTPDFLDNLQLALQTQINMPSDEAIKNSSFDLFLRNAVTNNLSFGVVTVAVIAYFIQSKNTTNIKQQASNKPEVVKVKKNKNKNKK
ncbi:DUF4199 domain-containing protein [Myroides sp. LJL119]